MKSTLSLTFKVESLGDGLKEVINQVDSLKASINGTSSSLVTFWDKFIDTAAIGATFTTFNQGIQAFKSGVDSLTESYASFDDAMRKANTMAGEDAAGFERLKELVTDLSREIPIAREALAEGLYQTISNGVPEDNWISYLTASARSAVGGVADLGKVVNVTSTMIKNYGLEWTAAEAIQDKIQMTAKNGVTSFEQLADALPRVAANASTLGVSIDELMATFATLTGVSGNTAEVSTQLAAIFKSLIKPTSDATTMATQMGIQFDAAAIKAAGGFQNFITNLRQSVTVFSATSGILEQEVYGKLFGSAEALRALTPLTGELADKYIENVGAMADATGEMAAAYEQNADSISSKNQLMKNSFAAAMDGVGEFLASWQPMTNLIAVCSNLVISIGGVALVITRLTKSIFNCNAAKTLFSRTAKLLRTDIIGLTISFNGLTTAQKIAAIATNALKLAVKGLMIATGIGAVIVVVTSILEAFTSAADDAAGSVDGLSEAERRAQQEAERTAQMEQRISDSVADSIAQYKNYISKLSTFNGTREEEIALLASLNEEYGKTFGEMETLQQWYAVLTKCSETYTKRILAEARARAYADEIAKMQMENYNLTHNADGSLKELSTDPGVNWGGLAVTLVNGAFGNATLEQIAGQIKPSESQLVSATVAENNERMTAYQKVLEEAHQEAAAASAEIAAMVQSIKAKNTNSAPSLTPAEMSVSQLEAQKALLEKRLKDAKPGEAIDDLVAQYKQVTTALDKRNNRLGLGKKSAKNRVKKVVEGDNLSREQLKTNIELYTKKLTSEDTEEQRMIREKIKGWQDALDAIELAERAAQRPQSLDTLRDIDKEIEYQRFLRERSSAENIAGIDAEILRLEKLKRALIMKDYTATPVDEIKTYEELNEEMTVAQQLMQGATADERVQIQQRINELQKLKDVWDEVLARVEKPADISTLDTIKELQKAVQQYRTLQQSATADEYQGYTVTIKALEEKIAAMQRGARLVEMQSQMDALQGLTGEDFAIEIQAIGLDGIEDMIRELQKMLADAANPLTDSQKEMAEGLISTLNEVGRNDALGGLSKKAKAAWGEVGNLGSAFSGLGSALEIPVFDVVGTLAQAVANMVLSYSTALSESSAMGPIGWMAFAAAGLAQLTAVIASVKNVAKFADGGIAYGPTLGLFGEYAGASSNPEVVAPLSKLTELIEPREAAIVAGHVVFDIEGRKLTGVLQNVQRLSHRS